MRETVIHDARDGAAGQGIVIANRLPFPPDDGWKVRTFHIVKIVARCAPVTFLVFHDPADEARLDAARAELGDDVRLIALPPPRSYSAANLVRGIVTDRPVHVWNQESPALRAAFHTLLAAGDPPFVLLESTFMERYMDLVPERVPLLVDTHNVDSVTFRRYVSSLRPGPKRMYAALTVRKLARLERDVYARADAVWVCSHEERAIVKGMAPGANVWTVPNGVDTAHMAPRAGDVPVPNSALFFGKLDYFPNVDAIEYLARDIVPRIRARVPDFLLTLAGPAATDRVREVARVTPGIRYVGRVVDVRELLAASALVLVPLRVGGGTRLKIVEAMAAGRPIVTTTVGAEGLAVRDHHDLVLADDTDSFINAACTLLQDAVQGERLGRAARESAVRTYDWSVIGEIVQESIGRLLTRSASS